MDFFKRHPLKELSGEIDQDVARIIIITIVTISEGTAIHCTGELTRKHVAEAFWNSEVESELRMGDINFKFTEKSDREAFMDAVDRSRANNPYAHTNCSEECRKRGNYYFYY